MRSEQEMFDLILNTAQEDHRIRAVFMNGSRTNPNAPRDIFQDYDIVYVVTETESFRADKGWIDIFGERLYMQYPEENGEILGFDTDIKNCYGWLMQFTDGIRLDLHVQTLAYALTEIDRDKLCRILLDKEGILPDIPEATDEDYHVRRPGAIEYSGCCNEFWWCLNNVAKGMWRGEIPYVQDNLNLYIRPQLVKMLSWKIGIDTDYTVSTGKSGKYMHRWLTPWEWQELLKTYPSGQPEAIWEAVFIMCGLFGRTAEEVGNRLGFHYNAEEAQGSMTFLKHVRELPQDAEQIF